MGLKAVASGGGGGGTVTGSGTPGKLAKFTGATALGDSLLSESGTTITSAATAQTFSAAQTWTLASSATALNIQSGLLNLNTTNSRVGVGTTAPATTLEAYVAASTGEVRASSDVFSVVSSYTFNNTLAGFAPSIKLSRARGTRAVPVAVNALDTIGTIGWNAQGTTDHQIANIQCTAPANAGADAISSQLTFATSLTTDALPVVRMTIAPSGNVGIGTASPTAGRSLTTAADCDIFGLRIGRGLLSEANSTALGASALNATVVGALNNTAVGSNAGKLLTTGVANTFAGYQSGFGTTTGGQNTYLGYSIATGSTSTGSRNTAIGGAAIASISSGSDNVIVGYVAAAALTTGTNNIIIGASANTSGAAVTNEIVIGASVTGAGSNTTTIGTTATTRTVIPGGSLTVAGSVSRTSGSTAGVANLAYIVVAVPETYKALLLSSTTTSNETLSSLHLIGSDVVNCNVAAISVFQTTVANHGSAASVRITNTSGGTATVKWSFLQIS